jgi:hypothetical protein
MRILTALACGFGLMGLLAQPLPARANDWCGFQQKAHSRVHCGYSSLETCKRALADKKGGDKSVTCMPDPASG